MGQVLSRIFQFRLEDYQARKTKTVVHFDPDNKEQAVLAILDNPRLDGFKGKVCWVAASGFFTTSYCIFCVNIIGPALNFVYPMPGDCSSISKQPFIVILTTLTGTSIGMILFGFLADKYGRKPLYGWELIIVILATIGLTQSSTGYNSMNVYGWIGFWRFILGIGLGAEYPLSATIAAEWSSTKSRGRMMASVFLMQSVGQFAAYAVSLAILAGLSPLVGFSKDTTDLEQARRAVDAIWRVIIGIGALPALLAITLRRLLPETPRFLAKNSTVEIATAETAGIYNADPQPRRTTAHHTLGNPALGNGPVVPAQAPPGGVKTKTLWQGITEYFRDAYTYLSENSRWRCFFGVIITWYLLDLAVYGLGLDSPRTISTIYLSAPTPSLSCNETWRNDPTQPNITIYNMLEQNSIRNLQTISTGTLPGSIIILLAIDYVPRAAWMGWIFVALAGLFAITGGTFFVAYESDKHAMTVVFYVLTELLLNLGPNTMTWILPAELFETKYRATFYGIAAAAGKLGAITIQVIINTTVSGKGRDAFAGMLLGMCPIMLLGALVTWVWVPEVQLPRGPDQNEAAGSSDDGSGDDDGDDDRTFLKKLILPNRTLEDIAENPTENQIIGFRANFGRLCSVRRRR